MIAQKLKPAPLGGSQAAVALSAGNHAPYPLAAKVCIAMGCIQVVASAFVWLSYGTGPLLESVDPEEVRHFYHAKLMLVPAMLLETCQVLTSRSTESDLALHGSEMSLMVVVEYVVKMAAYSYMAAYNGGVVHRNMLASGPARGCYSLRYLEWSIAVPMLLAINNYPLAGKTPVSQFTRRLLPSLFATWAYILASWLAQVTPCTGWGWFLVFLATVAYAASIWDQVDVVREADPELHSARFKIGAVIFKEVVFTIYGGVYCLGIGNWMSSVSEQMFYTYSDVMLKVTQASLLVVVRNWDDLAMLQRALRRQVQMGKEDMSRLFRSSMAPIFSISEEGFVVAWNEHLANLSRIPEADAVGKSILELIDPCSKENLKHAMKTCWKGLASGAVEVVLQRQSEEQQPVQMSLTLVMQHGSEPDSSILAIGQDLTELAAMKATQERKARFTAVLGHELRSPLHGIIGLSASMAEGAEKPGKKKQLNMIKGCATRLLDLVTNIMEIAKAEKIEASSEHALCVKPVNMMDLAEEVLGMTELAVDKRGCHLVGDGVALVNDMRLGQLPLVMGDCYKITQLLYNLVTNAAKFTTRGHIRLAARENQAAGMLEIDVEDTGKGISPDALSKIFEPFHQENGQDARGFQGVGLGLSVAQTIASLHGGAIRVASAVDRGSTFTVCLPCDFKQRAGLTNANKAEAQETEVEAKRPGFERSQTEPAMSTPPRPSLRAPGREPSGPLPLILSVGDDDINQDGIEQSLGSSYRVIRATSGAEALAYLDSGKELPSVLLLDTEAPGATALEALAGIRGRGFSHMQLPVILLSDCAPQDATARAAYDAGATDVMAKPFSSAILRQRVAILASMRREAFAGVEAKAMGAPPPGTQAPAVRDAGRPGRRPSGTQAARDAGQQTDNCGAKPPRAPVLPPSSPRVGDAVGRLEEIEALRRERDAFKARMEAKQAEAANAEQALRRMKEERERGAQAEVGEASTQTAPLPKAPPALAAPEWRDAPHNGKDTPQDAPQDTPREWRSAPKQVPGFRDVEATTMGSLGAPMDCSPTWNSLGAIHEPMEESRADYTDIRSALDFYKAEVSQRTREIAMLQDKLAAQKSSAWLERQRADALNRELRFQRGRGAPARAH